jgi:hypothetical protein
MFTLRDEGEWKGRARSVISATIELCSTIYLSYQLCFFSSSIPLQHQLRGILHNVSLHIRIFPPSRTHLALRHPVSTSVLRWSPLRFSIQLPGTGWRMTGVLPRSKIRAFQSNMGYPNERPSHANCRVSARVFPSPSPTRKKVNSYIAPEPR